MFSLAGADNRGMVNVTRWEAPQSPRDESTGTPRRGTASDAEIVLPGRGLQYPGQIAALDVQRCLIETKCRMEPGTVVEVWLRTEGMPLRLAARLVERQERGVQFEFQAMPMRKQEQIEALRRELAAQQAGGSGEPANQRNQ
jgi:hypothetical protein